MSRQIVELVYNKFSDCCWADAFMLNVEIHFSRGNYMISHGGRILAMIFVNFANLCTVLLTVKCLQVCCRPNSSTEELAEQWS